MNSLIHRLLEGRFLDQKQNLVFHYFQETHPSSKDKCSHKANGKKNNPTSRRKTSKRQGQLYLYIKQTFRKKRKRYLEQKWTLYNDQKSNALGRYTFINTFIIYTFINIYAPNQGASNILGKYYQIQKKNTLAATQ